MALFVRLIYRERELPGTNLPIGDKFVKTLISILGVACVAAAVPMTGVAQASPAEQIQPVQKIYTLNMPTQSLAKTLHDLASQTGVSIIFDPATVSGLLAPALSGNYRIKQALSRLLAGTSLQANFTSAKVVVVEVKPSTDSGLHRLPQSSATGTQADQDRTTKLGPVVTTAQRRVQVAQDVPDSLTVLTAEQLKLNNVQSARDLNGLVPGLTITKDPAYQQGIQVFIRGMGLAQLSVTRPSPVGVYLNGVYIGGNNGNILNLIDLERVEVLRGPQGTLYGRNSMAGAINLITSKPSGIFSGDITLGVSNYNGLVQKANIDLPQIGPASLSISAYSQKRDGWIESAYRNISHSINNVDNRGVRIAGLFELSPDFSATYSYDVSIGATNGVYMQLYSVMMHYSIT